MNLFYWDNIDALTIAIMAFSSIVFGVAYYFIPKSLSILRAGPIAKTKMAIIVVQSY
ncbi:hypothetical protein Q4603_21965 [Zobellia galactanivorans]|uniref:hypothetical protein n=1 Tax=Zobellia galactanivorans (strain DSM 12802 / CCUG 47099 / CIP 106680 / NCIMB 13871 / Dsij) TaxID=63186 RepID=UPI0026E21CC2|nr:hypothetical protein [Zobellia galactanivorans]MDO6811297.1 hypothetical protein [Zobellia galactanivorans]